MQDVYFMLQHVPFEAASAYPTAYPGMNLYLTEMVKYGYSERRVLRRRAHGLGVRERSSPTA